ncbi:MAG: TerD family protein [bacterium]|nr:TerD family protein [bacterium]
MAVSLQKGQKISLTKENTGLETILIGLGWDEVEQPKKRFLFSQKTEDVDCDASAILLKNGKLANGKEDIVYFGQLRHKTDAVRHMGDNLTGAGDGDDEQIIVELKKLPQEYDRIVVAVNIYSARTRNQHFGMIRNCFIRLVDAKTNREMCKYNLSENYDGMTAMIFGEVYRKGNEWKFNAIGQPTQDNSISELARRFQ